MTNRTVIFSHGHLSSPDSRKIRELAPIARDRGHATEAIDYRDLQDEPVARVDRLIDSIEKLEVPPILVGSSLGGYVSMAAAERVAVNSLFLMAPALYLEDKIPGGKMPERYVPRCRHVAIVHGWNDEVIPWQNSLRFAETSRAELHLLDTDHRLESAADDIRSLFARFLESACSS